MIDTQTPGTPGWWMARLVPRLAVQRAHHETMLAYRDGVNAVPVLASRSVRDSYRRLLAVSRMNFAELCVEASRERMTPVGFRTGADGDDIADARAHRIWQANHLDADFAQVLRSKMTGAVSYMSVGPAPADMDVPLILPESPRLVVTEQHPVRRRVARAGLKLWSDDLAGVDHAYVYLPGWVFHAVRGHGSRPSGCTDLSVDAYSPEGFEWVDRGQRLPVDRVPIVRFGNNEDDEGRSWGEFERHTSTLDRISFGVLQRVEIATMQAFRQRGLKGADRIADTDPQTGEPINLADVFASDPGALWQLPDGVDVWESGQVDLGPIRSAVRDDVQDFAAATRTPLYYLTPDSANGSAEGAALAREGLLFKVRDRVAETSEPLEEVMSLAFAFDGDAARASLVDLEVIWDAPDRQTLSERYDAAVKAQAAGVPWATIMRDVLGFSPAEIARMEVDRVNQLALVASFTGPAAP